jgi:hypothetical protein
MRVVVLALITVHAPAVGDSPGGGVVIPNEDGINGFRPDWDPNEFNLAAYLDDLHPDAALWYQHVQTLANPWLGGRQPGTRGDELAAEYITWYFNRAGLTPAFEDENGPSWRQGFEFTLGQSTPTVTAAELRSGRVSFEHGVDFQVLAPSATADVRLPLSVAGFGIESGPDGFSSFARGDDLTGRAVLLLRYEPLDEEGKSQWSGSGFSPHAAMRKKLRALTDRGAAAVLLVNPRGAGRTELESTRSSSGFGRQQAIPVLHISADTADALLASASSGSVDLAQVQQSANEPESVQHFPSWRKIDIATALETPAYNTWNVAGVLPGSGDLAEQWVVVGGHYDHLGHGYTGSRAPGDDRVHPGADDNASGVGTILILVDRLAKAAAEDDRDRRSVLFAAFSGEEAGLHGSASFVEHPPIDLSQTSLMLNLDMMGRLRGGTVALTGTGTAEEFDEMLPRLVEPTGLTVKTTASGLGPSDHSNFYRADVPVLFFFTGLHDDYHTPEDVSWRVNPEGTLRIIDLCEDILDEATHRDEMFTFQLSTQGTAARDTGATVRLGIMPSYSTGDKSGVLIDGVTEGTSAHDAGLLEGDVITAWDGKEVDGGADLMKHLRSHQPGDVVTITVVRDGKPMDVPVTLKGR